MIAKSAVRSFTYYIFCVFFLSNCSRPTTYIEKSQKAHLSALNREIFQNLPNSDTKDYTLTYEVVSTLYNTRNSQLLQSKSTLTNATKSWDDRWKQYLPKLAFNTSVVTNLEEISSLTLDDLSLFARLIVSVPEPTRTYAELARLKLTLLLAELNFKNEVRKAQLQINEFFLAAHLIHDYETKLAFAYQKPNPLSLDTKSSTTNKSTQHTQLQKLSNEVKAALRISDHHNYRLTLREKNLLKLPKTSFFTKQKPEYFLQEYLKSASLNLTASQLSKLGTELQNFPRLNLAFNTQPLFNSNTDDGINTEAFNLGQSNLSVASNYTPDIWDTETRQNFNNLEDTWDRELEQIQRLYNEIKESQYELKLLEIQKKSLQKSIKHTQSISLTALKTSYEEILNYQLLINRTKLELILGNEELYQKYIP